MKDIASVRFTTNIINIKTGELCADLTFFQIIDVDVKHLKEQNGIYTLAKNDLVYSNLPTHTIESMYAIADSVVKSGECHLDDITIPIEPIIYAKRFVHYLGNDKVMCIYINLTQEKKQLDKYELISKLYNFTTKAGNVSPFYIDLVNAPDKIWGSDDTADFLHVKPNKDMFYNFTDWTKQATLANGEQRTNEILSHFQDALNGIVKEYSAKYMMFDDDGNKKWYHSLSNTIERDENGNPLAVYGLNIEIDELVRSQEKLRKSEERLRIATESTKISTWEYDVSNNTGYISESLTKTFDCKPVQKNLMAFLLSIIHPDQIKNFKYNLRKQLKEFEHHSIHNYQLKKRNGEYIWVSLSAKVTKCDKAGKPTYIVGIIWDIDEQKKREEKLKKQNITDELTGLYNTKYLKTYLDMLSNHGNTEFALAFANIKNFRAINELYGYEFGDKALKTIGRYLRDTLPKSTAIFRDSGDEFVFVSTNKSQYDSLRDNGIIEADTKRAKFSIEVANVMLNIEFNRGIMLYPYHSDIISDVINLAKETLSLAKQSKSQDVLLYNNHIYQSIQYEKSVIDDFNYSDIENEFEMYYQNIINVQDPNIELVEALVRWNHPTRGFLTPYHFIDIIEKSGQIISLYLPMFKQCLNQLNIWEKETGRKTSLSYNFSLNILKLKNLCDSITEITDKYKIEPHRIHFELTESMFDENDPIVKSNINKLRKLGFKFAIDDFGTGYSSLSRVKDLEFDMIKIDKIFADNIKDETSKIIIKMIKDIAKLNHATCTIEGVETKEQFSIFENLGIEYVQGYYFNKPMNANDMSKFLSMKGTKEINIVWDDELLTGNDFLDQDHILLVEKAKTLVESFREKDKENIYIHTNNLYKYINEHFDDKELQMLNNAVCPNIDEHRNQHAEIKNSFYTFKQNVLENPLRELNAIECCHLITDWVYKHIKVYDKELAKYIEKK